MQGRSIKSQVHDGIMEDILDGTYRANDIINGETLMEKYGISKTPVREALVQFCDEGVLNSIPRFKYQLTVIFPNQIVEIAEYRKIIELGALEMSFLHLTRENFDQLKALNEDVGEITYTKDSHIRWETSIRFHETLHSFCNSTFIQRSLSDTLSVCTGVSSQCFIQIWNNSQVSDGGDHICLIETMEEGNLEQVKEILADDVEAFRNEIL